MVEPARVVISAEGRWRGALTSRALPDDPSIDELADGDRRHVGEMWLARAASERRVGDAFAVVAEALTDLGAAPELVALAERAVDDEMRHAELSRRMAERYAGTSFDHPPLLALVVPKHRGASSRLRAVLHVVGHACFNETIASAFLEAELERVSAPLGRAALRELLADEIDHAKLGWATLASVDPATREAVAPWLPEMAVANVRMWRSAQRGTSDDRLLLAHGATSAGDVEAALLRGIRDLVVPGFAHIGLDVGPLETWLAAGAPS